MKNSKQAFLLILIMVMGFASCKKKKTEEPPPDGSTNAPMGTFMFHLHTYIDNNEVDAYNIVYTTDLGRKISLSMAQLYVTNIQLVKLDGSTVDFSGKKILKVLETETYLVGDAPVGNYKSIRFKVGLDAATNTLSPTFPADSAILNKPSMWFSGTAQPDGYVFMNVQGKIDTTADASGTIAQMQPFVYKIGTNANYKQVNMPDKNYTIVEGQVQFGHILIDYNRMFGGVKLYQSSNLSVTTTTDNALPIATTIVNNLPSMFIYEQ